MPSRKGSSTRNFFIGGADCAAAPSATVESSTAANILRSMVSSSAGKAGAPPEHDLALEDLHDAVEEEPQRGYDDDHGKNEIHLQLEAEGGDERSQALLRGDELGDERADERECERGLEAGEDRGQRGGPGELPEDLATRGDERAHEEELVLLHGLEAHHGVDDHREERDRDRHHDLRLDAEAAPGDEDRREHDLGHDLESDDVGVGHFLEEAHVDHDDAERDRGHAADEKAG